jgi:hypothetical protein
MGIFDFFKKKKTSKSSKVPNELTFKGNQEAFDYSKKFFKTTEIFEGSAYMGLVGFDGRIAIINVIVNGKVQSVGVNILKNESGKDIKNKDFVLVGIKEKNNPLSIEELAEQSDSDDIQKSVGKLVMNASTGVIVRKLKPVLNLSTMNFEYDI